MSESGPSPYLPQTSINSSQPFIPPSLVPGQRARIWDKSATQRPRTSMPSPYRSPQRSSLYGDYFFSQPPTSLHPPPPLPQKPQALLGPLTNPLPPVPPKPAALVIAPASRIPLYPTSIPLPMMSPFSQPPEPVASETVPDEKEIERALTLSASEARQREQELIAQEEEELARALEESRLMTNNVYSFDVESSSAPASPTSPTIDQGSISATKASAHPPEGESWLHMITPTTSTASRHSSIHEDLLALPYSVNQNGPDDDPSNVAPGTPNSAQSPQSSRDSSALTPPLYANVVSNLIRNPLPAPSLNRSTVPSSPSLATSTTSVPSGLVTPPDRIPASPSLSLTRSSSNEHLPMPPFPSRPSWSSVSSENSTSTGRPLGSELPPTSTGPLHSPVNPELSLGSSTSLDPLDEEVEEEADTEPGPSMRSTAPLTANQYVEPEMLMGVCRSRL